MPVHKATGPKGGKGWQWGSSGKVYPTKQQAAAQGRAAYANGYKGTHSKSTKGK
jgi:hypothetical protein